MKKLKEFVMVVEILIATRGFAYIVLMFPVAFLIFSPDIHWSGYDSRMQQMVFPSVTKLWLAIPFVIFHILQAIAYTEEGRYAGIQPKGNIFNPVTVLSSYLTYASGIGFVFLIFMVIKFLHLYTGDARSYERKPIQTWWILDIIAVMIIGIIAHTIDHHITMETILGY